MFFSLSVLLFLRINLKIDKGKPDADKIYPLFMLYAIKLLIVII